jgi:hypothetical protein
MRFTNASQTGLAIDGVPYKPLEEIALSTDPNYIQKPVAPKATYFRSWDNSEIRKNFEGWNKAAKEGIKECDALLAMNEVPENRFAALMYVFNFRFLVDDLFVAFVVQCCARRFFELENEWWELSLDWETELKEKTEVIKKRFELFEEVTARLATMFKEEGN